MGQLLTIMIYYVDLKEQNQNFSNLKATEKVEGWNWLNLLDWYVFFIMTAFNILTFNDSI